MRKCKVLCAILLIFALVSCLSVFTGAAKVRVVDKTSALSVSEKASMADDLETLSAKTGADCYFYYSTVHVDDIYYDDLCRELNVQVDDTAIILAVSRVAGVYNYRLFTNGKANKKITGGDYSGEVAKILDNPGVYDNIKSGNLTAGVSAFCEVTAEAYEKDGTIVAKTIIGIIVGLLVSGITTAVIASSYRRKLKAPIYPLSKYANLDLTVKSDRFIGSHVTRTRVSSGSSGSRGSSSRGGGSRGSR
ncbi:MAG: hypothetical protein MJ082_03605 [Clostridia bacterium]|nr:hypothetical protein [Clostridia bacterium]